MNHIYSLCDALNDGKCTCRLNGARPCQAWFDLEYDKGTFDAALDNERRRMESNRLSGRISR